MSLQLFPFVCSVILSYVQWNKIASSTARNFHNSWSLHSKVLETKKRLSKYLTNKKWKMSAFFIFEINKKRQNGQNFQFFKGLFLRNEWPHRYDCRCVSETNVRLLKNITSKFFSKYSKSYTILNVKSCIKLNGPYQRL